MSEAAGMSERIRVLIVDDDALVRAALIMLLAGADDIEIVGEAADGSEVEHAVAEHQPDVVLMDIRMPGMDGLTATEILRGRDRPPEVIVLTTFDADDHVLRALRAGAKGYLLKDSAESDLLDAIRAVSQGKTFFSPEISKMLVEDYVREIRTRGVEDSYDLLTSREREILQLIAEGKANKQIAGQLNLSLHTVETHRRNLQEKLNLHSVAELILYAVRKRVIS